jgi:hypothetical protein
MEIKCILARDENAVTRKKGNLIQFSICIVGLSQGKTDLQVLRQLAERPFAETKGHKSRISNIDQ